MDLVVFAMWILVGLLAGLLAESVMKRGGYGLRVDVILGVLGGLVGGWIFWALGISPGPWMVAVAVVVFGAAAILIVLQRKIWPAIA
jgi:uncharacterized membrane protein YeaQ/YmgE (transglycosylase-associated protein family)